MTFEEFVTLVESCNGSVTGKPSVWKSVNIDLRGEGTNFTFHSKSKIDNITIVDTGGKNEINVGSGSKLTGLIKIGRGCKLTIGENLTVTGGMKLHLSEHANIKIGDDCMFGLDVNIFNHDYHPIFSLSDGKRINKSKTVEIGDHVWIANKSIILKGVKINNGSIIGIGSIVSNNIDSNSIAVGIPAKVIKNDIVWDRSSLNIKYLDGINHYNEI